MLLSWTEQIDRLHKIANMNKYDLIEKMLTYDRELIKEYPHIIECIYGKALYNCDHKIISLVNLFLRQEEILKSIYYTSEYASKNMVPYEEEYYYKQRPWLSIRMFEKSYVEFDEDKILEYYHEYFNMFENIRPKNIHLKKY
jgi:hypothetical protein